jgi:hypothetical protein
VATCLFYRLVIKIFSDELTKAEKDKVVLAELAAANDLRSTHLLAEKENQILNLKADRTATIINRAIYETMLVLWKPGLSPTAASAFLTTLLFDDRSGNLNEESMAILFLLEGESNVNPYDVAQELQTLYHQPSKPIHHPDLPETGLICGGPLPTRAAVALAFLKIRRECGRDDLPIIKYVDEHGKMKKILDGGKVVEPKELYKMLWEIGV